MFNKILHTFVTRFLVSLLNFFIVIITARYLGASVRGSIALLMLSVTIINIVNNIIGGSALVYLVPRNNLFRLLVPSYVWAVFSSIFISLLFYFLKLVELKYLSDLMIISFLSSAGAIQINILLGKEKVKQNNWISLLQTFLLLVSLIVIVFVAGENSFSSYLFSLYIGYGMTFIISSLLVIKYIKYSPLGNISDLMRQFIRFGFQIQLAYILQLMNYRFSYYLLDNLYGKPEVGIYSIGISVAEAVWLISRSIAMVQYAKISNTQEKHVSRKLSLSLVKLSFVGTLLLLIPVILFPKDGFAFIFGPAFRNIDEIILWLSPGIMALAISTVFTHYFSGNGMNKINTVASGIGFIFTMVFCLLLVPRFGIKGAALSASISYTSSLVYLYVKFANETHFKLKDYMPDMGDYERIKFEVRNLLKLK